MDKTVDRLPVRITKVSVNPKLCDFVYFYIKNSNEMEIRISLLAYKALKLKNMFNDFFNLCGQKVLRVEFAIDGGTTQRDFITSCGRLSIVEGDIFQDIGVYNDS